MTLHPDAAETALLRELSRVDALRLRCDERRRWLDEKRRVLLARLKELTSGSLNETTALPGR